MDAASRLNWLIIVAGLAAFAIGGTFVGRAFAGEHALASWYSAAVGLVGGGCCIVYGLARLGRRT